MRRREPEHVEQKAVFYWAALHQARVPELDMFYAIPNGRGRSKAEAGKLKAEGVKRGVPDIALDVARRGKHGLRIEMKAPGALNTVSADQEIWIARLEAEGYEVHVCDRWQNAWNVLMDYLGYPHFKVWPVPPLVASHPAPKKPRSHQAVAGAAGGGQNREP